MIGTHPDEEPLYECPYEVGDEVFVTGRLTVTNTVGGTTDIEHSGVDVRITWTRWDYETGWRFGGEPLKPEDVESIRRQATCEYDAEHYRREYPNNPALAESAAYAASIFNPKRTHFSEHDIAPPNAPRPR